MWVRHETAAVHEYTPLPHQLKGLRFLKRNERKERGGLILDEMGTGKTLQMIGLLNDSPKKTLIVVPLMLLDQWFNELVKYCPQTVMRYYAHGDEKVIMGARLRKLLLSIDSIILTTYEMFSQENNVLCDEEWQRIIFDEAHHMRNTNSNWQQAMDASSPVKWLLTGTPVQNKLREFKNLCRIVGLDLRKLLNNKPRFFKKHVLHRCAASIGLELVERVDCIHKVQWTNEEERRFCGDVHWACLHATGYNKLPLITQAKKMCILPQSVERFVEPMKSRDELPQYKDYTEALSHTSKLDYVIKTVLEQPRDTGIIIFCQLLVEMDMIVERLSSRRVGSFSGKDSIAKRQLVLQSLPEVLVCQLETASEGLNLQDHFSQAYFVSPNWNPTLEEQAIARIHRYGQKRTVYIHRFRMEPVNNEIATMDIIINRGQKRKREMVAICLDPAQESPVVKKVTFSIAVEMEDF